MSVLIILPSGKVIEPSADIFNPLGNDIEPSADIFNPLGNDIEPSGKIVGIEEVGLDIPVEDGIAGIEPEIGAVPL